jgi:hypothetical protein
MAVLVDLERPQNDIVRSEGRQNFEEQLRIGVRHSLQFHNPWTYKAGEIEDGALTKERLVPDRLHGDYAFARRIVPQHEAQDAVLNHQAAQQQVRCR